MTVPTVPRVVLDTNAVVSALLFPSGRLTWIRSAWQNGRFLPLGDRHTVGELICVLCYPKFRLSAADRESLLADYVPYLSTVATDTADQGLPDLRDVTDRKFLALAVRAAADALVTGDADILAVRDRLAGVAIMPSAAFSDWLTARGAP